jgi:hypothetical protein
MLIFKKSGLMVENSDELDINFVTCRITYRNVVAQAKYETHRF